MKHELERIPGIGKNMAGHLIAAGYPTIESLKGANLQNFLDNLRAQDGLMQSFDEHIFRSLVDRMTVYSKHTVAVKFRDGREIRVNPQK